MHRSLRSPSLSSWVLAAALAVQAIPVPARATTAPPRARLLLMDLRARAVDENTVRTIHDMVAVELARSQRFDVVSGDDLRQVLALEANRQLAGCDEDSCLAEVAGALGASHVVFGSVGALGELTVVSLALFDATAVRAVRRVDLRARSLEELPALMPARLAELLDEPALATTLPSAQASTSGQGAASAPAARDDLLLPLALVGAGSAGLVTGVVLGAVGYAVAYRPLEANAVRVQALEDDGPATRADATALQDQMDEQTTAVLLWGGAALTAAVVGAGLVGAGVLTWPAGDEGVAP